MNFAILCGSLEPGKDGVGDYTRRLADFCRKQGHRVLLISLNDSWITTDTVSSECDEIRLASLQTWADRFATLKKNLATFQPAIVSLQFVPYGYHPRGFCSDLADGLANLGKIYRWQIMFHELWLGLNPEDSLKYKLTGWWQRRCVLRLVRHLSPAVVHTQSAIYEKFLSNENITAIRLSLFSNIEIWPQPEFAEIYDLIAKTGYIFQPENRLQTFVAVFFGSLHPEWKPSLLMEKLAGKKILFLSLGRQGRVGSEIWRGFARKYCDQAVFIDLGELNARDISTALQFADAGIAASPWNLIEKSGSAAAMLEHGLPVIVTRNDFLSKIQFRPLETRYLHPLWDDTFSVQRLTKTTPASRLPEVGFQFLSDLQKSIQVAESP